MTTSTSTPGYTTQTVAVGQTELYVLSGGSGRPCLVLHGIEGHEGWLAFHQALAASSTVYAPSHPGYGHTDCPDWLSTIQHQAVFYHWFLQQTGLRDVDLVGAGMGGWIAAEMAVMCTAPLRSLTLIDAAGVLPERGEIADIFVLPWRQVIEQSFLNGSDSAEYQRIYSSAPIVDFGGSREAGRTMAMKMCFRPYMYDPALPGMLPKITIPTLIVWGADDRIIPLDCGRRYQQAIPGARLERIDQCGHFAHLDQPQRVADRVRAFISGT